VVVTNWNRADCLAKAVDSIMAQQEVELEVIIIDDASEDNSVNVARSLKAAYPGRVRIYETHESLTQSICLPANIGFKRARHDIVVLNPSDIIHLKPTNFKAYRDLISRQGNAFADPHLRYASSAEEKPSAQAGGAVKREHIWEVTGFDERIHGWGSDEPDLANRLKMIGVEMVKCDAQVLHQDLLPDGSFRRTRPPGDGWKYDRENAKTGTYAPNKTWGEHPKLEEIDC